MKSKIVSLDELKSITDNLKSKDKVVVATGGCFDILHAGHVQYLEQAKTYGDVLVLFMNSDSSVRRLKGPKRPIVSEEERAVVAAGLGCIDYVCLFDEDTPENIISEIEPDVWAKGADYEGEDIPEAKIINGYGGKIAYISFVEGCSSTNIVEKIIKTYTGE